MSTLRDIEVTLPDEPGALAHFGELLGRAGVSLEGGGVFTFRGTAIAHFLVGDAETASRVLDTAGVGPVTIRPVVMLALDQEVPGQLGAFTRCLADEAINILVQYSDHDHHLVIVTDPARHEDAQYVAAAWTAGSQRSG